MYNIFCKNIYPLFIVTLLTGVLLSLPAAARTPSTAFVGAHAEFIRCEQIKLPGLYFTVGMNGNDALQYELQQTDGKKNVIIL